MSESAGFFSNYFAAMSGGKQAYPWQQALFNQLVAGDWPGSVGLPTGAGKTSILKVWLIALGWSLRSKSEAAIPRRLVWVVNRRVVVDQTTKEAEEVLKWLDENSDGDLATTLREASFTKKTSLAISTLRGQKADNQEWSSDPLVPAIVVGTVDMVGSRLLFQGYRDGRYFRSKNAGLLAVDALIVNDEAHLTPAFAELLKTIENLKPAERIGKPFRTLRVSATVGESEAKGFDHDIEEDIRESARFRSVYEAEKRLYLLDDSRKIEQIVKEKAFGRTIVFLEKPEEAAKLAAKLIGEYDEERVALLTGTMRGYERDQDQTGDTAFCKFLQEARPEGSYFLVATSAGEVGVNITSETMLTGLVESDKLFQRLGRLNRFGTYPGKAFVFGFPSVAVEQGKETEKDRTLEYLRTFEVGDDGGIDVSCRALQSKPAPENSRSKIPPMARLEDRLIELWSQTTAPSQCMRGTASASYLPRVEAWLHGKQDDNYPETSLAWRAEVPYLSGDGVDSTDRSNALKRYRVLAHEMLKEPTYRLRDKLEKLEPATRVLLQKVDGSVTALTLEKLLKKDDAELRNALVLLPPNVGKLSKGMLQEQGVPGNDVADAPLEGSEKRKRYELSGQSKDWTLQDLNTGDVWESLPDWRPHVADKKPLKIEISAEEEAGGRWLIFSTPKQTATRKEVELPDHSEKAEQAAKKIAVAAALPELAESYGQAGQFHDKGKGHPLWQTAMGGDVQKPLAKTVKVASPRLLNGYRHESQSYLKATNADDLTLHLIASHHGWARPYWEERAFASEDLSENGARARIAEVAGRYARLQKYWGAWGLAYLEALMKSADVLSEEGGSDG